MPVRRAILLAMVVVVVLGDSSSAQNIVEDLDQQVFPRREISDREKEGLFAITRRVKAADQGLQPHFERLEQEVKELIEGWPWRPFFHQLGISGAETHFDHPDELSAVLAEALPVLSDSTAARLREFLRVRLQETRPYAVEGFERAIGQSRERYMVPENLRSQGRRSARDAWGVYGFWRYVVASGENDLVEAHWPAIAGRMRPLLEKEYAYDPTKTAYALDETQRLNGDLAGLCATFHLASAARDEDTAKVARQQAEKLFQLRLDLERVNPRLLERTDAATKKLHHAKLARYLHLPDAAMALLALDGTAAKRIRPFREARPGWWMAFGDRFVGGENYTNSPDFSRALFLAATHLESASQDARVQWLDVPWCKADLYFIERLTLALTRTEK